MRRVSIVPITGCWMWMGCLEREGYGVLNVWTGEKWKQVRAHRFAYEHARGPVPVGLVLDHRACDSRWCCNPHHVEAVTPWQNTARSLTNPAAIQARATHCKRGHEFDSANTFIDNRGKRQCRKCERARQLAFYYRHGRERRRQLRSEAREERQTRWLAPEVR